VEWVWYGRINNSLQATGLDMIYDMMDYINVRPKADEKPA